MHLTTTLIPKIYKYCYFYIVSNLFVLILNSVYITAKMLLFDQWTFSFMKGVWDDTACWYTLVLLSLPVVPFSGRTVKPQRRTALFSLKQSRLLKPITVYSFTNSLSAEHFSCLVLVSAWPSSIPYSNVKAKSLAPPWHSWFDKTGPGQDPRWGKKSGLYIGNSKESTSFSSISSLYVLKCRKI